jgi:hypothetical protein
MNMKYTALVSFQANRNPVTVRVEAEDGFEAAALAWFAVHGRTTASAWRYRPTVEFLRTGTFNVDNDVVTVMRRPCES